MTRNTPDERLVYLAFKNTFRGADAQVRKPKKIRELIQKTQGNADARDLIQEHNLDNVCNVAKALLDQQIFESTVKAKIRFPEVFEVSPAQSAERSFSEAEAAKLEADAMRSAAAGHNNGDLTETDCNVYSADDKALPTYPSKPRTLLRRRSLETIIHVPSLYPVYLPYQTQHQLLIKVQAILESACYNFGLRKLKDVIEREGWDCPERVELNIWARTLLSNQSRFQETDLKRSGKPFSELSDSISHLRHTAVHRLRISANALEQFLVDAESLSQLFQDDNCTRRLTRLRRETQVTIEDLKRNKDLLESKLNSDLKKIAEERAELDRREDLLVEEMLREDKEYQNLAGANLDAAINSSGTPTQSATHTEVGPRSESDFETEFTRTTSNDWVNKPNENLQNVED